MEQGTGDKENKGAMDLYPWLSTALDGTLGLPWWGRHKAGARSATTSTIRAAKDGENRGTMRRLGGGGNTSPVDMGEGHEFGF